MRSNNTCASIGASPIGGSPASWLAEAWAACSLRATLQVSRRTLRARYQLVQLSDSKVVLDATAGSDAGIDVVSSEYATVAAEETALENLALRVTDQIVTRLSLFAREQADQ